MELKLNKNFDWWKYNNFKENVSKWNLFLWSHKRVFVNIDAFLVESSNCRNLLENTVDSDFIFKERTNTPSQRYKLTLPVFSKTIQYLTQEKRVFTQQIYSLAF